MNCRSWRRGRAATVVVSALAVLAGCASNAPQDTWQPEGPNARNIDDLQRFPFYAAGVVGVIVMALVVYVVWKFRDRGQPIPRQGHGNVAIEYGTIAFSGILLAAVAVPTVGVLFDLAETDDCKMTVNVTGQQWWWEFSYPSESRIPTPIVTAGQLVIPTGECVLLRITSNDVIHSFWIPKLNGKRDAVPGRVQLLRMEADKPGIYSGQCTEFCGLSHANMKMDVVALDAADFATWVSRQNADALNIAATAEGEDPTAIKQGESNFTALCSSCHQVNGLVNADGEPIISAADTRLVSGSAPNLTHLMSRTTFAGGTYDLLTDECRERLHTASPEEFGALYLAGVSSECLNRIELKEWLRNAPDKKPMYPTPNEDGLGRGMPALGLSEDQINDLVEYVLTLQ